ncbi:MAG: 16S rRNA (guanine(527)-N(7))-methyltransferase RsmG [Alphaproteobacteria bacterium]|nr:16S rRNA (guanine(527)-N(7))-methyltransferase RsmG [Alphaproteobacteria bacterium]
MIDEEILSAKAFGQALSVSRETLDRLIIYSILLAKWQRAINLVSPKSLRDCWRRHFLDSGQLQSLIPSNSNSLLDIGSGAGFPGMVLAILGVRNVVLVESDHRKCMFLREVSRETSTAVTIINDRIEKVSPEQYDVVTSRACASLDVLLNYARPYVGEASVCLFPKGRTVDEELTTAKKRWNMRYKLVKSASDSAAKIVRLEGIFHGPTLID